MRKLFRLSVIIALACTGHCSSDGEITTSSGSSSSSSSSASSGSPLTKLILYQTSTLYTGNLGGRGGADAKCVAGQGGLTCNSVRAFLCTLGTDAVNGMPGNYSVPTSTPIHATTASGTKIADNWTDLLDGTIDATLQTAGWTTASRSGCLNGTGAFEAFNNCTAFNLTTGNSSIMDITKSDTNWLGGTSGACSVNMKLACLCF